MVTKKKEAAKQVMVKAAVAFYPKGALPKGTVWIASHSLGYADLRLVRKTLGGVTPVNVGSVSLHICSIFRAVNTLVNLAYGLESAAYNEDYTYYLMQGRKVIATSLTSVKSGKMEWEFNSRLVEFVGVKKKK